MTIAVPFTKYTCIDYPGIVNDHKKAIETLGNKCQLFEIFNDKRKRLELKFRRNDEHSRGIYGDHSSCNTIVLRIRRKKSLRQNSDLHVEILAYVDTIYSFKSLCDYQYQPIERIGATSEYCSLQPFLTVDGFKKSSWLFENVPVFIPCPQYSRYDKSFDLKQYLRGQKDSASTAKSKPKDLLWRSYKRNYCTPCPQMTAELVQLTEEICKNPFSKKWYHEVKEHFERIPIWTTNTLSASVNVNSYMLRKKIMASIGYYFSDGPWGRSWVRYGYDPLLDPGAKIYQTIQCRIKKNTRITKQFKHKSILQISSSTLQEEISEVNYRFVPDAIPTFCNVCYMLFDTRQADIQKLLHWNDGKETICTEKDGWLPAGTIEKCRNILKRHFNSLMAQKKSECLHMNAGNDEDDDKSDDNSSSEDDVLNSNEDSGDNIE